VGRGAKRDEQFATMIEIACRHGKPVRIGVNWGSLDQELLVRLMDENARAAEPLDSEAVTREALVASALDSAARAEQLGLPSDRIVLSCKVSGVQDLIAVYRELARRCDYPLHLGLTEAGMGTKGIVASTAALGVLLQEGIGDTIRVSLSADPVEEIRAGFDILKSLGLRHRGVNIVSCPSCARQGFNVIDTVRVLEDRLKHIATPMTLSIIGCVVNGPGEARETDMGFTGGGAGAGAGMIYLNGKPAYKLENEKLVDHVVELCEKKAAEIEAARNEAATVAAQ